MTIGYEMAEAASKAGIEGDVIVTKPVQPSACGWWGEGEVGGGGYRLLVRIRWSCLHNSKYWL